MRPVIGDRRKNPNLTDLLDTAASDGANRIMLTGKRPELLEPGVRHRLYADAAVEVRHALDQQRPSHGTVRA